MRKDKIDIVSSSLPSASFYVIEDYLRVHLQPYLKRFHSSLDTQLRKKIIDMIQFLEVLTSLSDYYVRRETVSAERYLKNKFRNLQIQKYELGYKILIDRNTVPANPTFVSQWNSLDTGVKIEAFGEVMIKLYGIPNCDKIKKARKLLEQSCVSYEFINLRDTLPDEDTLRRWLHILGEKELVNKRSTTFRNLKDNERNFNDLTGLIAVMKQSPTIIQRPLFEFNEKVKIGLSELSNVIEELN